MEPEEKESERTETGERVKLTTIISILEEERTTIKRNSTLSLSNASARKTPHFTLHNHTFYSYIPHIKTYFHYQNAGQDNVHI